MGSFAETDDVEEQRERYRELLAELRTIIPGMQVLFAFLLTVPFSARFTELDAFGRNVFSAALLGVATATVVVLMPAAFHRIGPNENRHRRIRLAVRCTVAGLGILGASITAAVFVVTRFIFDNAPIGAVFAIVLGALALTLWFVVPLLRHRQDDRR